MFKVLQLCQHGTTCVNSKHRCLIGGMRSRLVGSGGDISPVPSPVCVDEAPGLVQEFVGVGSKVVPLGLWMNILNRT